MPEVYKCDAVRDLQQLYDDSLLKDSTKTIVERLDWQARRAHDSITGGNPIPVVHLSNWSPKFVGMRASEIMASTVSRDDVRVALAREYGFKDWDYVLKHGNVVPDPTFEATVDLVLSGAVPLLRKRLGIHPHLATQRSEFGHRSTLLHYVAANGVETHRQVVPLNAANVVTVLLEAGADPMAKAEMYGGSDVMSLLLSSAHPAEAGVTHAVAEVLRVAIGKAD